MDSEKSKKICKNVNIEDWNFVTSESNSADVAARHTSKFVVVK